MLALHRRFVTLFFVLVLIGPFWIFSQEDAKEFDSAALDDFEIVWKTISEQYVDSNFGGLDWDSLGEEYRQQIENAPDPETAYRFLSDMVAKLENENTFVIPPWVRPPAQDESSDMLLEYAGVGILLQEQESGDILVLQVFTGTPAEAAGVLVGDIIVGVNMWRVSGENPMIQVTERVRGQVGTSVSLTLRDPEGAERTLEVTRAKIDLRPSVEDRIVEGTIGYLHIPILTVDLVEEGSRALPQLLSTRGLVLDLRSVYLGTFEGMVLIAQWFLGAGNLGGFVSREGAYQLPSRSDAIAAYQRPMVVLTDSRTSGVGEILTLLLSEYKRTQVVGNRTDGGYELIYPLDLPSGGYLSVAVGKYVTPRGELLPSEGIGPDFEVEIPDLQTIREGRDVYLEKAIEVLRNPRRL